MKIRFKLEPEKIRQSNNIIIYRKEDPFLLPTEALYRRWFLGQVLRYCMEREGGKVRSKDQTDNSMLINHLREPVRETTISDKNNKIFFTNKRQI